MSRASTFFEPEAFLHPFEGREDILERYLDSLPAGRLSVPRPVGSASDFLSHLNLCPAEESRVITSGLIEAWELSSSDENHEHLLNVLRLAGELDDYRRGLPAECLALELLTTNRELFESAITLDEVKKCDALELFRPRRPVSLVGNLDMAMNHFRSEIAARCQEKYGSSRVTTECIALVSGLVYSGDSMSEIAKRHGITRAAVSKRCVELTELLDLPPSRAMRSLTARRRYRSARIRVTRSNELPDHPSK